MFGGFAPGPSMGPRAMLSCEVGWIKGGAGICSLQARRSITRSVKKRCATSRGIFTSVIREHVGLHESALPPEADIRLP
jgi:hypothetical protein